MVNNSRTKVIIAVKDIDLRLSLDLLLRDGPGLTVVGTATTPESTLGLIQVENPELVLLEWGLCSLTKNGILQQIRKNHPDMRVVLLGNRQSQEQLAPCLGADAFLLIGSSSKKLLSTISNLMSNNNKNREQDKEV